MAEIVVTGGQGFLGSNLVNNLVLQKREVCATYNYTPPGNAAHTPYLSHFRIDVTDFQQCRKLIMQEDPVILYHLVAQPIVTAATKDPLLTLELTTRGTWNMLEAVRQVSKNIQAVVFMSSDKVYGENIDAKEGDPLLGIDHPYNVAKVSADVITQSYATTYHLPVVICRSGNLYGPGDFHWDRLVPGVCRDLYYGRPPIIRSSGKQLRDYIYISDGLRGLTMLAEAMQNGEVEPGQAFNLGGHQAYSSLEVVDHLRDIAGRIDLPPVIVGGAKDEIHQQHVNFDRAMRTLGWYPGVDIYDGLKSSYGWYAAWFRQ